ncbi:transmembrane protein 199-like [Tetranychus urticae]|uniref:Transmembrane protein n=1 Tax=Tetranychus urticae TaxID=32264 RepID=T1L067_TETUR|nr:transmembrane protein 199-like [Tetranychus urticae]
MVKFSEIENKQLDPREFEYRINSKIRKIITKCLKPDDNKDADDGTINRLKEIMDKEEGDKQMVSYDDLSEIHKCLLKLDTSYDLFFYQLLEETNVIIPISNKKPELQARLIKLKCEAAAKEYKKMTDGVCLVASNSKENKKNISSEVKEIKSLITALINGVLVVLCSFYFIYKVVEYSLPKQDIPFQIIVALAASTVIAIAELYFFIRVM